MYLWNVSASSGDKTCSQRVSGMNDLQSELKHGVSTLDAPLVVNSVRKNASIQSLQAV